MRFGFRSLIFISLSGFIFFIDHAQASSQQEDSGLENLIQQSVSQGYHEDFIDLVDIIISKESILHVYHARSGSVNFQTFDSEEKVT